jgi:hypothetical protein
MVVRRGRRVMRRMMGGGDIWILCIGIDGVAVVPLDAVY